MKTLTPTRLDQDTPKWPEVRITLGEHPTVTVSGVITPVDDEDTAITRCADQARTLGRPIRARITTATGDVRRVIVTADGIVTTLDNAAAASPAGPATARGKPAARPRSGSGRRGKGKSVLSRFPAPMRPVIRWGAPAMGVLVVASVTVMLVNARGSSADAGAPAPTAPVPPAGELYTELAPPGWSQNAAWVVDLAADAPAPVVTGDGTVVAVTARDNSATPQDGDERYLSVLEPTGQTRWAVPLDTPPRVGPLLLTIDGVEMVAVAGIRDLTYWPITSGPETVVPLPSGATVTPTGLVILPNKQLGYLYGGALQTVEALPRTDPAIALDGAVLVTQPDTGAWWTLTATTPPTAVRPTPPPGADAVTAVLATSEDQVLIGWNTDTPQDCIAAAYHRNDGTLIATATTACSALPRTGATYASNGTLAGVGPLVQTGATMTTVPGLTVTTVADQIYGTTNGDPVTVTSTGQVTPLPNGTLIPAGQTTDHLLVVGSPGRLYALERSRG
jgi:hypothetical protein